MSSTIRVGWSRSAATTISRNGRPPAPARQHPRQRGVEQRTILQRRQVEQPDAARIVGEQRLPSASASRVFPIPPAQPASPAAPAPDPPGSP
ncbi:MAG: hypothetical protein U0841_07240 [Chloroflexia bacterium]